LLLLLPPFPIPLSLLLPGRFQVTGAVGRAAAGAGPSANDATGLGGFPKLIPILASDFQFREFVFDGF
jgi:hypothetical protein